MLLHLESNIDHVRMCMRSLVFAEDVADKRVDSLDKYVIQCLLIVDVRHFTRLSGTYRRRTV